MTSESTLVDAPLFPRLIVRSGGRVVREEELRGELSVGRGEENDLQLMDPKVSRHHALIRREGRKFIVTDLGSANGTRVNGVLLTGSHVLEHGERITIGDSELIYQEPGKAFQDTVTMEGVLPGAQGAEPPVPPPPPLDGSRGGGSRGVTIGLAFAGVILALAVVASIVLMLSPDLRQQLLGPAPATAAPTQEQVAINPTSPAATEAPTAEAGPTQVTATPSPTSAVDAQGIDDLLLQAEALARRSKFEEAVAIYEELVQQAPDDARPEIGWAWALILDDDAAAALPHARRAVELDAESAEAAAALGRAYTDLGQIDEALEAAQKAVELDAASAQAHSVLAEAYMRDGQMQQAVDEADLALVQNINNANAHRVRGWLYHLADNDMGRAAGELQVAAGLQPELWLRRHELGLLLLEAEDYVTAIMAFQDALAIHPKAITYSAIGDAYYHLGQYDQARASLQQALSLGADDAQTYALLAATLAHLNRCDEAEAYYLQAQDLEPGHPLASEAEDLCDSGEPVPTATPTTISASEPTPVATSPAASEPTRAPAAAGALQGRIAFPAWNQQTRNYDVYVANVDGSGRQLVTEQMNQPAFNPDGTWLAVNGERHEHMNLFIVQPNGNGLHEISTNIEDALPDWAPDGKGLVFSSTRHGDKQSRIYIIDEVPFGGSQQEGRSLNFGPDDVRGEDPTWTDDGRIVYSGCDLTVEPAPCGLYTMSAAPGAHPFTQLTDRKEDTAPAAEGDRVAFMSNREGNWEIYIVNLDGTGLTRLTNNAANDGLPTWSPDGRTIAFVSDQGGGWAVWAMNSDGSNRRKLFAMGGGGLVSDWQHQQISWAP
jgi:TolB protein